MTDKTTTGELGDYDLIREAILWNPAIGSYHRDGWVYSTASDQVHLSESARWLGIPTS